MTDPETTVPSAQPPAGEPDQTGSSAATGKPPAASPPTSPASPPRPAKKETFWSTLLPDSIERWIRRDRTPADPPGTQWRPSPDTPTPGVSSDPMLQYQPPGVEWTPSTPILDTDAVVLPPRTCLHCEGEIDPDGYCTQCGAKAENERDHFREQPADWVGGVCDRGIRHARNEDAMALAADQDPGSRAVLVVCDGVSSSEDSDIASLAAAQAARDYLWDDQARPSGNVDTQLSEMTRSLTEAAATANRAVVDTTDLASTNAASATFAGAVIDGSQVFVANLGDSRVYWLPDTGEGRQLTVDDSVAQDRIEAGISREQAENGIGAHAITKWLGRDAPDLEPRVAMLPLDGDGWLLVCSDGIWNYASAPAEIDRVLRDALTADPGPTGVIDVCETMVAWANEQGGKDNITVALARVGSPVRYRVVDPQAQEQPSEPSQPGLDGPRDGSPTEPTAASTTDPAGTDHTDVPAVTDPTPDDSVTGSAVPPQSSTQQAQVSADQFPWHQADAQPAWQTQAQADQAGWQPVTTPQQASWQQPTQPSWQPVQPQSHPTWQQPAQPTEPTMERYVPPGLAPQGDGDDLPPYPAMATPADPPPTAPADRTQLPAFPVQSSDASEEYRQPETPQQGHATPGETH